MNLALGALVAMTSMAPASPSPATPEPAPEYAVAPLALPCLEAPCDGVLINDLALDLEEPGGASAGATTLLVGGRLFLGLRADEKGRALSLSSARWDVGLEHRDDRTGIDAELRGGSWRLSGRATDHEPAAGDGWRLDLEAALRLSPDLELLAGAIEDEREGFGGELESRIGSEVPVGALWQRGPRFEIGGRLRAGTLETPGGIELDRRAAEAVAVYQARRWRLDGALAFDDLSGRFDRREAAVDLLLAYRVTAHLVAAGGFRERHDLDLGSVASGSTLELTYFARRFRFARGGEAARRTAELARRALEAGLNERREHDLAGRRDLRHRLEISTARDELAPLIEALHRAQIEERNVPIAGLAWSHDRDDVEGSETRRLDLFVAVPWPHDEGSRAWRHDEATTDFLRFTYGRTERDISRGFTTEGERLAVDVSLRRELGLRFSWEQPAATGLEFALRTQQPRRFLAQLVYRRGV